MSRPRLLGLLLALVTLVVYLPVRTHDFVNYDDDDYVTNNPAVQNGLAWSSLRWAFTTWHAGNWHPLTWLSHMADCELFGLNPAGHHLMSALIHAVNAALLLLLLVRLTHLTGPAAFIAALFAWHPLHVESVAWVAERKDVLSTFFALLALLAYAGYARSGPKNRRSFWLAVGFFALGLLCKPMLVTLPCVLLLLDFWPLQRFPGFKLKLSSLGRLALEKWPFFLLTAISCLVTFFAQRNGEAVASLERVSLHYRLENAPVAIAHYLWNMIWPVNLAVIYPLSQTFTTLMVGSAVVLLMLFSAIAWFRRVPSPYLLVGWLWFVGTLVPVIGLVQVGGAALADRYTYFPAIGIFMAVAFAVRELAERLQLPKMILPGAAMLLLGACVVLTEQQLGHWQNSETLFRHALAVTKDNDVALVDLGVALDLQGHSEEALEQYHQALRLTPDRYQIHCNIANILDKIGRPEVALAEYREAVRCAPKISFLHNAVGETLAELGRFEEAMSEFTNATQLDATSPWPHFQMAKARLKQGRDAEAIDEFRAALRLAPENFQILAYIAHVLAAEENPEVRDGKTALVLAIKANNLAGGTQPQVLDALGMACAATGDFTNAQAVAQQALDLATAAKMKNLEPIQQRLELYRQQQPWHESFLATNTAALPKN